MADIVFCYLDVGKSAHIQTEIRYSISTLLAEIAEASSIVIYTDKPEAYTHYHPAEIIDPAAFTNVSAIETSYIYKLKPLVLLHALRTFAQTAVFIDSDTYVQPGFFDQLKSLLKKGVVVDDLIFKDDASFDSSVHNLLVHRSRHFPDRSRYLDGNSGLIGVSGESGKSLLEDTIAIIDEALKRGRVPRTLEQTALFEALWLHNHPVNKIRPWLVHYCTQSKKRYMRYEIQRLFLKEDETITPRKPVIKLDQFRVKTYQYYFDVRKVFQPAWGAKQVSTWVG